MRFFFICQQTYGRVGHCETTGFTAIQLLYFMHVLSDTTKGEMEGSVCVSAQAQ